jgi:hypothetical protein
MLPLVTLRACLIASSFSFSKGIIGESSLNRLMEKYDIKSRRN